LKETYSKDLQNILKRKQGTILRLVTNFTSIIHRDGIGLDSSFRFPSQLVMDSKGFIYLVDENTIRKMNPQFEVTTLAKVDDRPKSHSTLIDQEQIHIKVQFQKVTGQRKWNDLWTTAENRL
jgi:hypothetical protein